MDTLLAFAKGEAARARGDKARVFDWILAAEIIRDNQPSFASAGLSGDWEWTGGVIYENGSPVPKEDTYTFLASIWAIPAVNINGHVITCWVWNDETSWDAETYWPQEALDVLNGVGDGS